jgi:hypothetical protein
VLELLLDAIGLGIVCLADYATNAINSQTPTTTSTRTIRSSQPTYHRIADKRVQATNRPSR